MTEKQKMLAGELYRANGPDLSAERMRAQDLLYRFNSTRPEDMEGRLALLKELVGSLGEGSVLNPSFQCDYGYNLFIGRNVFVNYDCVFLWTATGSRSETTCRSGRPSRSTRRGTRRTPRRGGPGSNSRCR